MSFIAAERVRGREASVESTAARVANRVPDSLAGFRSQHDDYDERAVKGRGGTGDVEIDSPPAYSLPESPASAAPDAPEGFPPGLPSPEPLADAHAKSAQSLEQFAGEFVARCVYSRNWHLREASLVYLQGHAEELAQPGQEREGFRLLCQVAVRGLGDKVANVFLASASFIRTIATGNPTLSRDLQFATAEFLPILVGKLGDTNPRIRDAAHESILMLARLKDGAVKNHTGLFTSPVKKQSAWRPVLGRLELVSDLVEVIGVGKGGSAGFDVDQLMSFVARAYTSPNASVRTAAIGLTARLATVVGPVVKKYVPGDVNPKVRQQVDQEIDFALGETSRQASPARPSRRSPGSDARTPTTTGKPTRASSVDALCRSSGSQLSPSSSAAQLEEDPAVLESALRKQGQLLGDDHPDLAEVLTNLATAYTQREEFDKAHPLLKRVLDINEAHFGCDHSNVAHALTDLAVFHMEQVQRIGRRKAKRKTPFVAGQGQDDEGRPLLERALLIQEKNLGADHPDVVAIRDVLAADDE